jgi:cytochrome c oxidase assembly protein subunit 15
MTTAITEAQPVRHDYARIRRWLRIWLWTVATLVMAMVVVGGITRLTESGLSITEWQLVQGIVPPLSEAAWQEEFNRYKQIPEYQNLPGGMTLEQFKAIYWPEYIHRLLGRVIGLLVIVPLAFLWFTGRLERQLQPRLLLLAGLVVFQGVVGWWMVQSGLAADDVNPLWLAFHLTLGLATLGYVTVLARSLSESRLPSARQGLRVMAAIIMVVAFLQVFYGGLMAGLNAGLTFNTWPMMDGQFIPARLIFEGFQVGNLLSDVATVQFVHRMLAYVLLLLVLVHLVQAWRTEFAAAAFAVLWLVGAQAILGILTLLLLVPVPIALLHQFGSVLVVFSSVLHWRAMSPPLPLPAVSGG